MTEELKKYCIEKAVSCSGGGDPVALAKSFYEFLREDGKASSEAPKSTETRVPAFDVNLVRPMAIGELTTIQRRIVQTAVDMDIKGEKCNGTTISKRVGCSQATASSNLVKLEKMGYIQRNGNKYWPLLTSLGEEYKRPIRQYPPGHAKGYSPDQQKVGNIGSIRHFG